jgi:hypothetical protein
MSVILASILGAAALVADASAASERPKLTGFGGIQFGLTESELRTVLPVVKSELFLGDAESVWFEGVNPVEVDGALFLVRFMLERGILRRIGASRGALAQDGNCKPEFDAMIAYLASLYGPPDKTSQRGARQFYLAEFEFEDHAFIELLTTFNDTNRACIDDITYFSPAAIAQ